MTTRNFLDLNKRKLKRYYIIYSLCLLLWYDNNKRSDAWMFYGFKDRGNESTKLCANEFWFQNMIHSDRVCLSLWCFKISNFMFKLINKNINLLLDLIFHSATEFLLSVVHFVFAAYRFPSKTFETRSMILAKYIEIIFFLYQQQCYIQ